MTSWTYQVIKCVVCSGDCHIDYGRLKEVGFTVELLDDHERKCSRCWIKPK